MAGVYGWSFETTRDFIASEVENVTEEVENLAEEVKNVESEEETSLENSSPNPCIKGYYWCVNTGEIPAEAVKGGVDKDGGDIYLGRALHEGELQPAKIVANHSCAYIAFNGEEIGKDDYEILCRGRCMIIWQECQDGMVPHNAVVGGYTADNEKLYIGRVFHDGTQTPGKVQPSHNTCYIPYGGEELSFPTYEVLILK